MNYSRLINSLFNEAKQQKHYAKLSKSVQVLMFIALIPFFLVEIILYVSYSVTNFIYNMISSPCEYLEGWVSEKQKGVHWLSEAVIFLITLPFIFFLRVLLSFTSAIYAILWFFIMIITYIVTLGGIRWQPYINNTLYDDSYTWKMRFPSLTLNIFSIITFLAATLFCLSTILYQSDFLSYDGYIFVSNLRNISNIIYLILVYIGIPIIFAKRNVIKLDAANIQVIETNYDSKRDVDFSDLPEL